MTNFDDIRLNEKKLKKIVKSLKKTLEDKYPEINTAQLLECMATSRGFDNWRDLKSFIKKSGVLSIDQINDLSTEVIQNSGIEQYTDESVPFECQQVLLGLQLYYNYEYISSFMASENFYKDERELSLKVISDVELTALGELFFAEAVGGNYDEAFYLFNKAAVMGNPLAHSFLADMYLDGLSVDKSPSKALELYDKSLSSEFSESRDTYVKIKRAKLYLDLGIEDKINYAIDYLSSKSETHGAAAYELALIYMRGKYLSQDMTQAETLIAKSADLGCFDASYMAAFAFKQQNDIEMFLKILESLAQKGFRNAASYLGQMYFHGDVGIDSNPCKAKNYCYQAALYGDVTCQNIMGIYYETGIVGELNHQLALDWYTLAADGCSDYKANADRVSRLLGANRHPTKYEILKSLSDSSYDVNI